MIIIVRHAWKLIGAILIAVYGIKISWREQHALTISTKTCGVDLIIRGGLRYQQKKQMTGTTCK